MSRPRETVWSALRIAIKPTALAEVAARSGNGTAYLWGFIALPLATLPSMAAGLVARDPVNTVDEFVRQWLIAMPATMTVGQLLFGPIWAVLFLAFYLLGKVILLIMRKGSNHDIIIMLSPLTVCIPLVVWSFGASLESMSRAVVNKPIWLDSPIIDFWASPKWLILFIVLAVAFGIHAARRFGEFPEDDETPTCVHCQYNLTGNISGVCPECGTAIAKRRETQ